ncbi:hypothetical protein J2T15_004668 [Paenibacillus harenae]|uniref:Uncharacterized protein n=1 Tax=Paenibacillus harenae TaxID=306543 RepID=A0ABT9U943_PAEHA|nr:hypothetical protein [Paenibacillus harenae]
MCFADYHSMIKQAKNEANRVFIRAFFQNIRIYKYYLITCLYFSGMKRAVQPVDCVSRFTLSLQERHEHAYPKIF